MTSHRRRFSRSVCILLLLIVLIGTVQTAYAQHDTKSHESDVASQLAEQVRKSLVVVRATDRAGDEAGFGAGFAVDQPGLIATARHVIGDGRDFTVELPDGTKAKVVEVFASSSQLDLAIIRIDDTSMQPLPLSTEEVSAQTPLIALGHPLGRKNQTARGTYSGNYDIDDVQMMELAMPIEPGNSGGPILTVDGDVVGLVTMKSSVKNSVGYALSAKLMRQLIDEPNPIPMARWKTIGSLDATLSKPVFGAEWKQRATKILVKGVGDSFGGRTLCVRQGQVPECPFDLKVDVKLGDEQGAAGLIFHSDGSDRHYGFYPSAGNLRLTRFDGPDVGSWTILHNEPHASYRAQEWNTLMVRIHTDHFECFLNGEKVIESRDGQIPHGAIGLAAFRGTPAEFRRFEAGTNLLPESLSEEARLAVNEILSTIRPNHPADTDVIAKLIPFGEQAPDAISAEADRIEKRAIRLRQLAVEVHEANIRSQLIEFLSSDNTEANVTGETQNDASLLHAALLVARMDNADVDVNAYIDRVQHWTEEIRGTLAEDADEATRLAAMDRYLFEELGVHGSRFEYYTRANSYINEVIEDREGIPITLSVLYIELGRRLHLNIQGIGLPGHFVVQHTPEARPAESQIIDPFERGKRLSEEDVVTRLSEAHFPNLPQFRVPQTNQQICERMIGNLLGLAEREKDDAAVLRYLETLVEIDPANPEYRAKRLEMRARSGRLAKAIDDANWFFDNPPDGIDLDRLRTLRSKLETDLARQQAENAEAE